jgi:hypothetical protein
LPEFFYDLKTKLKSVSPQEEFPCSLGIDSNIKIDYKPIKKYRTHSGMILTGKTISTTFVQVMN